MDDFLIDTIELCQGVIKVDRQCSVYHFYNTCDHVNKTMLLVDDTPTEYTFEFFERDDRCIVLDGRKIHMDRNIRKMQLQLVLEETRRVLVHAMIKGLVVVVRLGDIVCDFLTFNDE